jgi:hypothetical protein
MDEIGANSNSQAAALAAAAIPAGHEWRAGQNSWLEFTN